MRRVSGLRILSPLRAAYRWLYWRLVAIRERLAVRRERVVSTTYEGFQIYYPSLSIIGQEIASGHSWQGSLGAVVEAIFPESLAPVVVEVGSNIGASLIEIKRVRPDAVVYCFEPSKRFADVLDRNVDVNRLRDVTVERVLVGSSEGTGELFVNSSTASLASPDYGGHRLLATVPTAMVTLDGYFDGADRIDLLKIDTDGYDLDVVKGARVLTARHAPAIYCEFAPFLLEETGGTGPEFLELLADLGYGTLFPVVEGGQVLAEPRNHAGVLAAADAERYVDLVAVHDSRPEQAEALRRAALAANR